MSPQSPVCTIIVQIGCRVLISFNLELKKDPGVPRLPDLTAKVRNLENRKARQVSECARGIPLKTTGFCRRRFQPCIPAPMLRWPLNQPYHHLLYLPRPRRPLIVSSTLPPQTFGRKPKSRQGDTTSECCIRSSTKVMSSSWFWTPAIQKVVGAALWRKKSDVEKAKGRNSSSC